MPKFDYECKSCGREAEHSHANDNSPSCIYCGSGDMKKLPSRINIGGTVARKASLEDTFQPAMKGLKVTFGVGECSCGFKKPVVRSIEPFSIDNRPSSN